MLINIKGNWVDMPAFTGPTTNTTVSRSGYNVIKIKCLSKLTPLGTRYCNKDSCEKVRARHFLDIHVCMQECFRVCCCRSKTLKSCCSAKIYQGLSLNQYTFTKVVSQNNGGDLSAMSNVYVFLHRCP